MRSPRTAGSPRWQRCCWRCRSSVCAPTQIPCRNRWQHAARSCWLNSVAPRRTPLHCWARRSCVLGSVAILHARRTCRPDRAAAGCTFHPRRLQPRLCHRPRPLRLRPRPCHGPMPLRLRPCPCHDPRPRCLRPHRHHGPKPRRLQPHQHHGQTQTQSGAPAVPPTGPSPKRRANAAGASPRRAHVRGADGAPLAVPSNGHRCRRCRRRHGCTGTRPCRQRRCCRRRRRHLGRTANVAIRRPAPHCAPISRLTSATSG
eukprot:358973-Chlamydomonas_euryale.AAC.1